MKAKQATFQALHPEVRIYDPKSDKEKLFFSTVSKKVLREYSFKTSVDDVRGQFSLTFYPDEYDGSLPLFDQLKELDIVKIYEKEKIIGHEEKEVFRRYGPTDYEKWPTINGVKASVGARYITPKGHKKSKLMSVDTYNLPIRGFDENFPLHSVKPNTTYYYWVTRRRGTDAESEYSEMVSAGTGPAPTPPPATPSLALPPAASTPPTGGGTGQKDCNQCHGTGKCDYNYLFGLSFCSGGYMDCTTCSGKGTRDGKICTTCNGAKKVKCPMCGGSGKCKYCNGTGKK